MKILPRWTLLVAISAAPWCGAVAAVDSYRYLHVTIDTPWMIFLGLLVAVLVPFIVMAVLYWRYAGRKPDAERQPGE